MEAAKMSGNNRQREVVERSVETCSTDKHSKGALTLLDITNSKTSNYTPKLALNIHNLYN